jgi:hypothetical protein
MGESIHPASGQWGGTAKISTGKDGVVWHFRVWTDHIDGKHFQRIYFCDEAQREMGCAEFADDQTLHVSKIKQRMQKVASDASYRKQFQCELRFPIERYYS